MNLLGSHDRERIATVLQGDRALIKLAFFLQFALPGVPCVYYGDEVGMTGGKDPHNRGPFPWNSEDRELAEHLRSLTALYREHGALRGGEYEPLSWGDDVLGCRRRDGTESLLCLVNRSDADVDCFGVTVPARGWVLA